MTGVVVSQIVAIATNSRAIGKDNQLLWHVPEDLKHFKKTTMGKPIVMGRKTYDSVGFPLPGRTNIVISRDTSLAIEGVIVVDSCEEAIAVGKRCCEEQGLTEFFVAGGAEIYRQTLALTDKVYLSLIDVEVEGDTFYPVLPSSDWALTQQKDVVGEGSELGFVLQVWARS